MTTRRPTKALPPADGPHKRKLRDHFLAMIGVEQQILESLSALARALDAHPGSAAFLGRVREMAEEHVEALRVRLMGLDVSEPDLPMPPRSPTVTNPPGPLATSPSAGLQALYGLLSAASFGYSVLHVVAHRQLDSPWAVEEGNAADLADEQMREYARVVEMLDAIGCEVAVWELSREGLDCRCVCPSCALGICLCWVHGTAAAVDARRPVLAQEASAGGRGVAVSAPRADSVALRAGLGGGEAIVAIDNHPIEPRGDLGTMVKSFQSAITAHEPGDTIRLQVQDPVGRLRNVQIAREVRNPPAKERRLAAIVFTDMVGFTALAQADEPRALELLEEHRKLVRAALPRHRGREVKTIGDAFLLEFASALDATVCAIEVQRAVRKRNQLRRRDPIRLRIGIHVGDLISLDGDIYGDAVNIASRIEPMAEPGGICVSQQVYDQVWNKVPVEMAELTKRKLKNVSAPIGVYRVAVPTAG